MRYPGAPWVADLHAALRRAPAQTDAEGLYETSLYISTEADEGRLISGLGSLAMFLYEAATNAAEPASWNRGGAVRAATWERLLEPSRADASLYPKLQLQIGEAFAWWNEESSPEIRFAGRPVSGGSIPAIDSLSLLVCEEEFVIRAVQAKATIRLPRPPAAQALEKFELLQAGTYDDSLNEMLRLFGYEVLGDTGEAIQGAGLLASGIQHFAVAIVHGQLPPSHPAHDYGHRIVSHASHGRVAVLFHHMGFRTLVAEIAEYIERQLAPDA